MGKALVEFKTYLKSNVAFSFGHFRTKGSSVFPFTAILLQKLDEISERKKQHFQLLRPIEISRIVRGVLDDEVKMDNEHIQSYMYDNFIRGLEELKAVVQITRTEL